MFPLIWFGGLTTSHGAGLAVPDWPNTYGYNMFAVPFSVWLSESAGGIFFEHTHRLLGSLVGFLALGAVLFAWGAGREPSRRRVFGIATLVLLGLALLSFMLMRLDLGGSHRTFGHLVSGFGGLSAVGFVAWLARTDEPRPWVRWGTLGLLGGIIAQGVLGGLRVTEVNLELAIVHGVFAQLTFCLAGLLVLGCSRTWQHGAAAYGAASRRLLTLSAGVTVLVLAQLTIAAAMRHYQAGLAVPDFPLSYGAVMPPVSARGLERVNELRAFDLSLPPTTLGMIWLHTLHRIGALIITTFIAWLAWVAWRARGQAQPRRHIALLGGLLVVQLGLGMTTIWMRKPADIATAHVAVGAVLLLTSWLLTVRLWQARSISNARSRDDGFTLSHEPRPRQSAAHTPVVAPLSA